jgi:hypothetical protein
MKNIHSLAVSLAIASSLGLAACSGSSVNAGTSPPAGQAVQVHVSPSTTAVDAAGQVAFAAEVTGTAVTTVTWSVQEAGGGSVDGSGLYTAPAAPGTYHVIATSTAAPESRGVAEVTVRATAAPPVPAPGTVAVTVTPPESALDACRGAVLAAQVTGATNGRVAWTVLEPGGGTVVNGIYTAPATGGTYHVVATSEADPNARGSATMTVGPPKVLSVGVSPTQASTAAGGALAFAATVTTSCGSFPAQ